jgi:hypothetical protein
VKANSNLDILHGMTLLDQVKKYITNECVRSGKERDLKHYERTLHWLKKLDPDADEAFEIAAFSHDAERVFRAATYQNINKSDKGFRDEQHLKHHQQTGAKIIADFLLDHEASPLVAERAAQLISKHEVGGDKDQNTLKDADSISFFETNVDHFLSKKVLETGKDKVRDKFNWMYDRITSKKAKKICKNWYENALKKLEQIHAN